MIDVKSLTRTYGELKAVDRISCRISPGESVGRLGHNGAGKTTILKMMTGFLEPTSGSIVIDGLDIADQREAVQARIGYLPENDPLYPEMTVIDYLDYAASLHGVPESERPARIREAVEKTGLGPKASEAIGTLSRGYRQRVGVAQAILHHPKVLILDEPTNGLDPTQVQQMRELIRSLAKEAPVIISTPILQEVQAICDRVIIIRNGRKALDSTMAELRASKRLLLGVDAGPDQVLGPSGSLDGGRAVEQVETQGPVNRYRLNLGDGKELTDTAPQVASTVLAQGWKLFVLQPETRDLETIFGEIAA